MAKKKVTERTPEQIVESALAERAYEVMLGGQKFEFKPLSLSDRDEIAAIVSEITIPIREDMNEAELLDAAIKSGKYAKHIAKFISVGAHVRGLPLVQEIARRRILKAAYEKASSAEIRTAVSKILSQIEPGFILGCLISLNRQNILKKTNETEATAHG